MRRHDDAPVEWRVSKRLVAYDDALAEMEKRVTAIHHDNARELIWLLEHPPLYTAGSSAKPEDLITPDRFPVHKTGRGGQYTYHGPGQRVAYVMLDLNQRRRDIRAFIAALEDWLINTLATFDITGERRDDRVGIWVRRPEKGAEAEDKIAAIGIRLRRWITLHGISVNISPDLSHFDGIVACGIREHGVTSLEDLNRLIPMSDVDMALRASFERIFGPTREIC